ncbi:MAG: oligosaccharide flippase family protein [Pseudomonadota bacterium]|nr:oligosaccharide flippase family protein [Pseudomonadota bacterium]
MSAVTATLERRALSLGTANAVDYALQFLLPMVLTRTLDPQSFGEYRLLWLAVSTLMLVTPMCMAPSLYYFLPRSDRPTQRLYINQTMLFLLFAGVISAWALSEWNPFLPGKLEAIHEGYGIVVPAFVLAWVFASLLDILPTAEERVAWQAKAVISLSAIRAVALSAAAIFTRELAPVLWTLLAFTALKAAILVYYVAKNHGLGRPLARRDTFGAQVKQAAPFALSGTLHGVRTQGDQWIAAALFTVPQFASFSVATVLAPLVQIFRQSVNHVFLPSMSRLQSTGDFAGMLALNSRANCMVALLVYPLLAFAFVFAEPLIKLIYTATYLDAVPVLRLYSIGLIAFVVELVSTLFVLRQGAFAAKANGIVLLIALPLSIYGAMNFGLMGAAMGSVAAIYAERLLSLQRIALLTETPIRRLQDWGALGALLVAAMLAAGLAGLLLHWSEWTSFPTLLAGGLIMAIAYPPALYLTGRWGDLIAFIDSIRNKAARA